MYSLNISILLILFIRIHNISIKSSHLLFKYHILLLKSYCALFFFKYNYEKINLLKINLINLMINNVFCDISPLLGGLSYPNPIIIMLINIL